MICDPSEAWRKRRYAAAWVSKLNDAEGEAAETQTWLEFAVRSDHAGRDVAKDLFLEYEEVVSMLVSMEKGTDKWVMRDAVKKSGK